MVPSGISFLADAIRPMREPVRMRAERLGRLDAGWGKAADVLRENFDIGHEIGAGLRVLP